MWAGGIFVTILATLATPGNVFSHHAKLFGVRRRDKLMGHINKNHVLIGFHVQWKQHISTVPSAHLRILEICITEWIQAHLTSRQNQLSEVKCGTAVYPSNSSRYNSSFGFRSTLACWHSHLEEAQSSQMMYWPSYRNKSMHLPLKSCLEWLVCGHVDTLLSFEQLCSCVVSIMVCQTCQHLSNFSMASSVWTVYPQLLMYKDSTSTNLLKLVTTTSYLFHGHANVSNLT